MTKGNRGERRQRVFSISFSLEEWKKVTKIEEKLGIKSPSLCRMILYNSWATFKQENVFGIYINYNYEDVGKTKSYVYKQFTVDEKRHTEVTAYCHKTGLRKDSILRRIIIPEIDKMYQEIEGR